MCTGRSGADLLADTMRRMKALDAQALSIVKSFLKPRVDESDFLMKLKYIHRSHYEDVIEERRILHLCAYPLCGVKLKKVTTKRYQISTSNNVVYDLTERKKFCSSQCFKASEYIRQQILTSPILFRVPKLIPEFKLLKINKDETVEEFRSLEIK